MSQGTVHEYLGVILEFIMKGKFKVRIDDCVEKMIQTFPQKLRSTDVSIMPSGNNLFENGNGEPLGKLQSRGFHTMVAKSLVLSKRARPDIQPTIYVLDTRVRSPNIILDPLGIHSVSTRSHDLTN